MPVCISENGNGRENCWGDREQMADAFGLTGLMRQRERQGRIGKRSGGPAG